MPVYFDKAIRWPEPTMQEWDYKNVVTFLGSGQGKFRSDAFDSLYMTLLGATEVMDEFVTENRYNVNYNDTALYSYDGYAIRIEATIADEQPVGMCIEDSCWSFDPIY